ncbi:MAG: DUF1631 family protein, partial [Sinobacterium sp.]|nr:DUF1631 family protein [Sinobacterium sp.]
PPTLHQTTYRSLASTAPENSHVLPTHAVAQLVNDMQKGYEPIGDGDVIRYIRQQLRLKTVGEQAVTISQHDENTINLVSLCFRAIAAPLSKSLAPLILRLKPVYARVALNDDFFFHDTSHPAHRLLDQILKLINSNFNDKAIRRYVTTVVMKVQLKFTDDITLFDKLLDEIDVYFADEKLRYQENQFDLVQKFSDKENQQKSIALCDKYLQNLIDTLSSKLNFFEFFKAILNPVLVQKYLQYGEMSDEWKAIDKHIQHIFSMLACEDIDILRKQIKNSANANIQLGQLLSGAGVSVTNTDMLLAQLQDIQVLQMQGKTLSDIKSPQLAHYQPMRKFLLSHQQGNQGNFVSSFIGYHHSQLKAAKFARIHPLIIDSEAEDIVRSLTVGNWLSMLVDQKVMRLQLGFYSKTTEHFVFFDGDHKKTFERSTDELERDFSSGFACRIEYTANFDTALVEVSKSLSLRAPSPR